jgi:hypothetical protein
VNTVSKRVRTGLVGHFGGHICGAV